MTDIERTIKAISPLDREIVKKAQRHLDNLTKPQGSLGRLEDIAKRIVGIRQNALPLSRKVIFTFASDHGIARHKVSAFPQEVTRQMVYNFIRGGAAINVLARHTNCAVVVIDIGVKAKIDKELFQSFSPKAKFIERKIAQGTRDISSGPAMSITQAKKALKAGIEIFEDEYGEKKIGIVGTGDMGIANTTPSAAIISVLTQTNPELITGRGTGIDNALLKKKVELIKKAILKNKPDRNDPIDVLAKLGGYEIAGIVGLILSAARYNLPVVIDGFISTAAAMLAVQIQPNVRDYLLASHCSSERGHKTALAHLGLKPILDLKMRLGEGTGATLAISIIEGSLKIYNQMATFQEAEVSGRVNSR